LILLLSLGAMAGDDTGIARAIDNRPMSWRIPCCLYSSGFRVKSDSTTTWYAFPQSEHLRKRISYWSSIGWSETSSSSLLQIVHRPSNPIGERPQPNVV
jgi:hypothetical protein